MSAGSIDETCKWRKAPGAWLTAQGTKEKVSVLRFQGCVLRGPGCAVDDQNVETRNSYPATRNHTKLEFIIFITNNYCEES